MPSFMHTLDRDGPLQVEVTYHWQAGSLGSRSSLGVPEEPDEEPSIELESVISADGTQIILRDGEEYAELIEAAEEHAKDEGCPIGSEDETPIWDGRD